MKLPKRLNDLVNRKQEFIDLYRNRLEKTVLKLQSRLLDQIIAEVVSGLDVKDGIIQDTKYNYRLLADLDKVYSEFTAFSSSVITSQVATATTGIVDFGRRYFAMSFSEIPVRFDKIIEATASKINLRVGLQGGKIVRGGFLESMIKDNAILTDVKNYIAKSVTGQIDRKDFIQGLTKMVSGDTGPGKLEKQYQRFTYDLYQQYDRAYNNSLADEFKMNYFLYQGGLIEDSRDFCVAHNNKVWTREEAATWPDWRPSDGVYPEGYVIKQKNKNEVPSYLKVDGYDPLVDFGGPRCRHGISWISDELAFRLRPDLKNKSQNT